MSVRKTKIQTREVKQSEGFNETEHKRHALADNNRELLISFVDWYNKRFQYENPERSDVDAFLNESTE